MSVASQVGQTLANLQNAQATLEIYAIQSPEEDSCAVFREAAAVTARIAAEMEEDLKRLECVNAAAEPSGQEPAAEDETPRGLS